MPKKDLIKEQSWIKKLDNFASSELTAKQWCEINQEKIHTFKYWKARLGSCKPIRFEQIPTRPYSEGVKVTRTTLAIELPVELDEKPSKPLSKSFKDVRTIGGRKNLYLPWSGRPSKRL